jgi:hypothetical protein
MAVHMERFVVLVADGDWLVTYRNRAMAAYATRDEAETSAFRAAEVLAAKGLPVSVVVIPDGLAHGQHTANEPVASRTREHKA